MIEFVTVDPARIVTSGPITEFSTLPSILQPSQTKEFIILPVKPTLTGAQFLLLV